MGLFYLKLIYLQKKQVGSYTTYKNTVLQINLPNDFAEQGWGVSGGTAYHSGCNAGYIKTTLEQAKALNARTL